LREGEPHGTRGIKRRLWVTGGGLAGPEVDHCSQF